jgi:hypothetical protein
MGFLFWNNFGNFGGKFEIRIFNTKPDSVFCDPLNEPWFKLHNFVWNNLAGNLKCAFCHFKWFFCFPSQNRYKISHSNFIYFPSKNFYYFYWKRDLWFCAPSKNCLKQSLKSPQSVSISGQFLTTGRIFSGFFHIF